jgi:hypothetical protein
VETDHVRQAGLVLGWSCEPSIMSWLHLHCNNYFEAGKV